MNVKALGSVALLSLVCLGQLSGCARAMRTQATTSEMRAEARRLHEPAMRCDAEREIALAEANVDFAQDAIDRGLLLLGTRYSTEADEQIAAVRAIVEGRPECFGVVEVADQDGDTIPDDRDNCVYLANTDQADMDQDGIGDRCDNEMDRDGDGLLDTNDGCPDDPEDPDGFEDQDGCPDLDNDGDRIPDLQDACPTDPEDFDDFHDDDGCPELDNDRDGIEDTLDQCPNDPEDIDGDRDEDGCPDVQTLVVISDDRIDITQQILFETNSSNITGDVSFQILDEVGDILIGNPEMEIRIEGHTDAQGSSRYNRTLSQGRADSVMSYLVHRGVDSGRLTAIGHGEDMPIETNETAEGRAANRRVEFHIVTR